MFFDKEKIVSIILVWVCELECDLTTQGCFLGFNFMMT
jgi:hypothetical protein